MSDIKTCDKRAYQSEHSARRKLRKLRHRRRIQHSHHVETRAYHCPHCRAWHLTSEPLEE